MPTLSPMDSWTDLPHPEHDRQFYAGVPAKRAAAWVIDALVILVAAAAVTLVFGVLTLGFGLMLFPFILFGASFLYRTLTIAASSATWGMMLMGIEFRDRRGHRLDLVTAALHTGLFLFLMASVIGWIATVAAMLLTRYNQGVPDLLLGTTAINRPLD
ncbi:RDD family protein [Halovulum dunhuangense]|uniref:RDD family protein n=1 Tax=Halovulum dunhuangense TaxID=1505036 RepID=A0A849L2G9_9RHOB|nr:RDD family protein [Halovulum dunhuangense]NNU80516.1 RDD family protein [Halovulum dunhuangense]